MIRKISGKNKSPSYTHLNMVGTDSKATSKTDIADTLGETFCHNSSSFNYSESFRKIKTEQEKVKLNFKSQNSEIYNKDFNLDELVEAIQLSHNSATGPDEIHYQMLKHLPENSLETLLNIFNDIWTTGKGALAWYGKLTWESAHAWILKKIMLFNCLGYNFNVYGAFEFLCNSIANL